MSTDAPIARLEDITAELLNDRDAALRRKKIAEGEVDAINIRLEQILTMTATSRYQVPDGSVVQIVAPAPREKVSPEKLLARGVDARIITDCTILTPVKTFVRVDRPKPAEETTATRAAGVRGDEPGDAPEGRVQ